MSIRHGRAVTHKALAFEMAYDDAALTPVGGTTSSCQFGTAGVPPHPSGRSTYLAGCVNLPGPGGAHSDCTPGPCELATVVFLCGRAGTFDLTLVPPVGGFVRNAHADALNDVRDVFLIDGTIICALGVQPTATPSPSLPGVALPTFDPSQLTPGPTAAATSTPSLPGVVFPTIDASKITPGPTAVPTSTPSLPGVTF